MLFSAIGPNGKFSLHGSETTKTYFPAAVSTSQNCHLPQKIAKGESVNLIRRSICGRNSISNSKTVGSSNSQKNPTTTSLKKEMDVIASPLIKTISGRINIGTEYLKETVQKVFNITNDNTEKNPIHLKSSTNLSPKNVTKTSLNVHHANNINNVNSKNDNNRPYKQPLHFKENCEKQSTTAKGFTLPPSIFHRQVEAYRTDECHSVDNLNKEMCHFRPIRLAPISPWKSGINLPRRGVIVVPKTIISKTENLTDDSNAIASIINEKLSSTRSSLVLSPLHKSAFVSTIELKERTPIHTKKSVKPVAKTTRKTRRTNNQKSKKSLRAEENESTIKTKLRSRDQIMANKKSKSPKLMKEKVIKINHGTTQRVQKKLSSAQNLNKKQKKTTKTSTKNIGQPTTSPPLTRARLREMGKSNLNNALQHMGRYI